MKKTNQESPVEKRVTIKPLNEIKARFLLRGTAPLVMNRFGTDSKNKMMAQQMAGSTRRKGAPKEGKNFELLYEAAKHLTSDGKLGIPATAFRNALISTCRTAQYKMTMAKMTIFVEADGYGDDGTPYVVLTKGEPFMHFAPVRNQTGVADIRARPMIPVGWECVLRVKFDADAFTLNDVANLLVRAGVQNGVCEGRPNSKESAGMGWGTWDVVSK